MKTKYLIYKADEEEKEEIRGVRGLLTRILVETAIKVAPSHPPIVTIKMVWREEVRK